MQHWNRLTTRCLKRATATLFPRHIRITGQTFVSLVLQTIFKPTFNKWIWFQHSQSGLHNPLSSRPMINGLIFPNQTLEFKFRWVNAKVNIVISSFDLYRISGVIHNKSETRQFAALYGWLVIKILTIRAFMYLGNIL